MTRSDLGDSVCFERFEVDHRAHLLRCDGQRIALQEQPFQVLLALLETPGEVITRDALRRRLWGDHTFVDFNQSMNSAVRRLRQALGDDPEYPIYIETIPRVGYRFIAQIKESAEAKAELEQDAPQKTAPESREVPQNAAPQPRQPKSQSWLGAIRWRAPVVAIWCLAVFAGSTLLPWEVHLRKPNVVSAQAPQDIALHAEPATVAVLPLRNLTGRSRDQYVVDGITEAVTTELAERPGLRVMSQVPPTQRQPGAGMVLEGGVRRQGDHVWITAQLLDTKHGTYLWANTYSESARDLARNEIAVAEEVAREVDSHLTNGVSR